MGITWPSGTIEHQQDHVTGCLYLELSIAMKEEDRNEPDVSCKWQLRNTIWKRIELHKGPSDALKKIDRLLINREEFQSDESINFGKYSQ
jgi:hypothetical protein